MEELCNKLLNNGSLRSLALKLAGDLHEDLLQEVALAMLEQNKDISSYFEYWCIRTMINMTSKNGTFWKQYSERYIDQHEIRYQHSLEYEDQADKFWKQLDEIFSDDEWYKRELLKTYFECGSYRNVEKLTSINHVSVHHTVKDAIKTLHDRIDNNIN